MSRFVLDASVALAWCFPDEESQPAERVADLFRHGHTAIAPAFWPHEVLNALLAAEKRKRISTQLVQSFLGDLGALPVALEQVATGLVFSRILTLSREHELTAYDAAYLDLAIGSGLPLATLDKDLLKACREVGAEVMGD
ncbi:MAG TPA: type II toxin-antitoxin system VapC family toxin [Terriglobales bacterium]